MLQGAQQVRRLLHQPHAGNLGGQQHRRHSCIQRDEQVGLRLLGAYADAVIKSLKDTSRINQAIFPFSTPSPLGQ